MVLPSCGQGVPRAHGPADASTAPELRLLGGFPELGRGVVSGAQSLVLPAGRQRVRRPSHGLCHDPATLRLRRRLCQLGGGLVCRAKNVVLPTHRQGLPEHVPAPCGIFLRLHCRLPELADRMGKCKEGMVLRACGQGMPDVATAASTFNCPVALFLSCMPGGLTRESRQEFPCICPEQSCLWLAFELAWYAPCFFCFFGKPLTIRGSRSTNT